MRKLFSLFAVLVFLCVLFVGCDMNKQPVVNEPEDENPSEETFSMCVPVFGSGSMAEGSKGLHNLTPEGSPFGDDFWGAAYCIQNLPMFFGVSKMDGLTVSSLKSRLNIEYKVFGLTVSPVLEAWKVNKDGVYLRYRIIEPDFKGYGSESGEIGYFDYYWNFEEHMFTYREVMALTLKVNGSYSQAPIAVMVIEYDDVKVEMKDGSLCYSIGNVGSDGKIEKNGFIDFINVNSAYTNNNEWLFTVEELFDRRYVTADSKDGLFVSIVHADNEITTGTMPLKDHESVSKLVRSICHSGDLLIDTDKEAARFNMSFCWELLPLYYKNVDDLKKHDPNHEEFVGGYSSYSEYRKTSFEEYSEYVGIHIGQAMEKHYTHNCFNVVFDYMTGRYANECKGEKSFGSFDGKIDSYEKAKAYGYTDIFTSLDESTKGWPYFLFLELFKVCGVDDLDYMKNYSYASSKWGKFNWPLECANEDHETFKAKVDKSNQ